MALVQRRWTRALLALGALALAGLAIQSLAWANVTYTGRTSQHLPVNLRLSDGGRVVRITLSYRADCGNGHLGPTWEMFIRPFQRSTTRYFTRKDHYNVRQRNYLTRLRFGIVGKRASPHHWKGTFHVTGRVFKHGHPFTRCHARVRWGAKP